LYAVADVACWFAGISERARHFAPHVLNSDVAFQRLTIKIVAKTCRESRKQQLASVDAGAAPSALWGYPDCLPTTIGFDLNGVT
jgi:hypothetical protein